MSATRHPQLAKALQENLAEIPMWIKQYIYLTLRTELLESFFPENLDSMTVNDTLAFYVPRLTAEGERGMLDLNDDMGKLLRDARDKYTVLDLCVHHNWTLETCCQYLMDGIRQQWLHSPSSIKALGTIEYLSNHIRLGEYLVKMGSISQEQLEQALRTQQYIKEAMEEHTGLANIMINLGYITRHDTEGILFLKEESRKLIGPANIFNRP